MAQSAGGAGEDAELKTKSFLIQEEENSWCWREHIYIGYSGLISNNRFLMRAFPFAEHPKPGRGPLLLAPTC